MKYIEWNEEKLRDFLKDKKQRSVDVNEYLLLIDFINKIQPTTIIDVGTYLGSSSYILGTCCKSIKHLFSIENIDCPDYYPKPEATKEEHGKYLPNDAIFIKDGYINNIKKIVDNNSDCFIFWDAGKNTNKVIEQIKLSYDNNVKYIAIHDTALDRVRKAIKRAIRFKWYRIVCDDITSCPSKGVTILERR